MLKCGWIAIQFGGHCLGNGLEKGMLAGLSLEINEKRDDLVVDSVTVDFFQQTALAHAAKTYEEEGLLVGGFLPKQADITEQLFSSDEEEVAAQAGANDIILFFWPLIGFSFFIGMKDKIHRPLIAALVQIKGGEGAVDDITARLVNMEIKA